MYYAVLNTLANQVFNLNPSPPPQPPLLGKIGFVIQSPVLKFQVSHVQECSVLVSAKVNIWNHSVRRNA